MKTVGKRSENQIDFHASAEKLKTGALFNDEMQKLALTYGGFFKKGVYRYKTHEDANKHWEDSLVKNVARKNINGK
ncbi:MAG: hypothetical protein LHV68_11080 [Elusimicrobia bacterium]|nr:hypothetical protein [Candidatus Liberimonas magnetica]